MTIFSSLCYVQHQGRVLMLERRGRKDDLHQGKFNGLGGKLLPGESPEQGIVREVQEESGLHIDDPTLGAYLTFPGFDGENDWIVFAYTATRFSGQLLSECTEGALHWVDRDIVHTLPMWEGDALFLKPLLDGKFIEGSIQYQAGRVAQHSLRFFERVHD